MTQQDAELQELLDQLAIGNLYCIDYGDGERHGFFRIRCIKTHAGLQYALKQLHNGIEGSGAYFPLSEEGRHALNRAIDKRIDHTNRDMGLRQKLSPERYKLYEELDKKLGWQAYMSEDEISPKCLYPLNSTWQFGGVEPVTIELPEAT